MVIVARVRRVSGEPGMYALGAVQEADKQLPGAIIRLSARQQAGFIRCYQPGPRDEKTGLAADATRPTETDPVLMCLVANMTFDRYRGNRIIRIQSHRIAHERADYGPNTGLNRPRKAALDTRTVRTMGEDFLIVSLIRCVQRSC